jgi:hypothetical protein
MENDKPRVIILSFGSVGMELYEALWNAEFEALGIVMAEPAREQRSDIEELIDDIEIKQLCPEKIDLEVIEDEEIHELKKEYKDRARYHSKAQKDSFQSRSRHNNKKFTNHNKRR